MNTLRILNLDGNESDIALVEISRVFSPKFFADLFHVKVIRAYNWGKLHYPAGTIIVANRRHLRDLDHIAKLLFT